MLNVSGLSKLDNKFHTFTITFNGAWSHQILTYPGDRGRRTSKTRGYDDTMKLANSCDDENLIHQQL